MPTPGAAGRAIGAPGAPTCGGGVGLPLPLKSDGDHPAGSAAWPP